MSNPPHASLAMTDIGRVVQKLRELRDQSAPGEQAVFDDLLSAAGVVETSPLEYNPYLPGVHVHPYPHYHKVQAENPVHWSHAMQAWIISRHADVAHALRDARLSYRTGFETIIACVPPEEHDGIRAVTKLLSSLLNEIDPPEHTRLRRVMTRALTMTDGPQQASHIESVANQLLDQVQFAGCMDIVKDFAYPLPAIIGDDLLNIPAQDRSQFGEWIVGVIRTFSEGFSQSPAMHRGEAAVVALTKYLRSLLAERRSEPGHDVLSAMLRHGEASEDESILIATNIIMGMHENLTHAISLSMNTLLRNPDLLHWVRTHPESFDSAVEEMLRYDGTAPILSRVALDDIEIAGVHIPKGQRVILLLGAANRDSECFLEPDRFVPDRRPNPHIAFGVGRRMCPGSAPARTILKSAVTTLLARFPDMKLTDAATAWREEINIHGLRTLPVTFTARDAETR
jgi:cytochrome P450